MSFGKRLCPLKYTVFLLLSFLFCSSSLYADSSLKGKSYKSLLSTYGEPLSKQEYEVKRREIWIYKNQKAYIEQGRIVHVGPKQSREESKTQGSPSTDTSVGTVAEKKSRSTATVRESDIEDLLSAVEAAGEQDDDKKGSRSKRRSRRSR